MITTTPTTTAAALHSVAGPAAPLDEHADETPCYRHMGNQRFMPANEAAHREVARWNAFADRINCAAQGRPQ